MPLDLKYSIEQEQEKIQRALIFQFNRRQTQTALLFALQMSEIKQYARKYQNTTNLYCGHQGG
jgi:hypothetical protein